jgi:hypothetical protein
MTIFLAKVENISKGSQDLITSPSISLKIQIMGGKVYLTQIDILLNLRGKIFSNTLCQKLSQAMRGRILFYLIFYTWFRLGQD